jgi:hypothetical protein
MRLDGSLAIHEAELLLYRHIFHYDRIEHTAGHRRGEGNTTVRIDEDWHIDDWAPTRRNSSFSLIEHRWAPTR